MCLHARVALILAISAFALTPRPAPAEDWGRFRGPNGTGISSESPLPAELNPEKNLAWKIAVAEGVSSPIVAGDRVFITSCEGDERRLHCLGAADGREHWVRSVRKVHNAVFSKPNNPAGSTPVTDGRRVVALFPDAGLVGYTAQGEELWRVDLGLLESMRGVASSPVMLDGRVVVVADVVAGSFIAAFDSETGKQAWRTERANGISGAYSSPSVYRPEGKPAELVVPGPMELVAYNAATGERAWWAAGVTKEPVSVPVMTADHVFICENPSQPPTMNSIKALDHNGDGKIMVEEGKEGLRILLKRVDEGWGDSDGEVTQEEWFAANGAIQGKGGLTSVRLGGEGDVTSTHVEWNYRRSTPYVPSALAYGDVLYIVQGAGILVALEPKDGTILKRARMDAAAGDYIASPVAGDGKIYFVSSDGAASVVEAGREWKVLASHSLDEQCHATPAISGGRVYVRTAKSLWCFGPPAAK